ncbi:MAG: hypothetical protein LBE78_09190 [Burkholderiaceae bacterium]|jgi:hypothetical protein|nr:hypothetical protein [Burkholderiaceae bacterium]
MKRRLLLGIIFFASFAFAAQEAELGCKRLRIVLDPGLNQKMIDHEWASGKIRTEEPTVLQLVGCEGQLLDRFVLEAPLAKLDPEPLRGAHNPTYLVTADLTAEAGSYNGPLTVPIEIIDDRLVPAMAKSPDKSVKPIRLSQTLKSGWKRVPYQNADELLSVTSQPKSPGFVTIYRRYFLSPDGWQVKQRTKQELWESDSDFPSRTLFP